MVMLRCFEGFGIVAEGFEENGKGRMAAMKKRNGTLLVVLCVLLFVMAGLAVYFYPAWRAAKLLEERMGLSCFSYEVEVELNGEALSGGQVKAMEALEKLTGIEQKAMDCFAVKGSVWEDKVHALIYPEGAAEPLLEFYQSDEVSAINETILYNKIRNHLLKQNALLNALVPVQEKNMYMTLEQMEQLFGVALGSGEGGGLPFFKRGRTAGEYFFELAFLRRRKLENGRCFEVVTEQVQMRFAFMEGEKGTSVTVQFCMEEPAQVLRQESRLLSILGMEAPDERLEMLKRISITVYPGEGTELEMPTEFVSQDIIDLISRIRALFERQEKEDVVWRF